MSDELTPEEADLLAKLLAKAGKEAVEAKPEKKGEFGEDVEIVHKTDTQEPVPDTGDEIKGKLVAMACRVKGVMGQNRKPCEGRQARIIRSANKSMNFGTGELAGGGRVTTYRCETCNGVFTIST